MVFIIKRETFQNLAISSHLTLRAYVYIIQENNLIISINLINIKTTIILLFSILFALSTCSQNAVKAKAEPHSSDKQLSKHSQAAFAAGCFWHEKALFESVKGVKESVSGYVGGNTKNPTYESIETGSTGMQKQ